MGKFVTQNNKNLNLPYKETNNYNVILINDPEDEELFINLIKVDLERIYMLKII
jgi:hypothetical protein